MAVDQDLHIKYNNINKNLHSVCEYMAEVFVCN